MIFGIGMDLIEIERIEQSLKTLGNRFVRRIGRPAERNGAPEKAPRRGEYWAARFAAKEAFAKALGTGIGSAVRYKSVGVVKAPSGKPCLEYSADVKQLLKRLGVTNSHLTITHNRSVAAAVVILEREPKKGSRK